MALRPAPLDRLARLRISNTAGTVRKHTLKTIKYTSYGESKSLILAEQAHLRFSPPYLRGEAVPCRVPTVLIRPFLPRLLGLWHSNCVKWIIYNAKRKEEKYGKLLPALRGSYQFYLSF